MVSVATTRAAQRDDDALVRALLAAGASANAPDSGGVRPLHIACRAARGVPAARCLLAAGADANAADATGRTALLDAAWLGRTE